ncbi:zf-HC2 domain-containing protein [Actinokineospora sp. NBRC 105648]|uniref:zf-HC2 domain-containing protein n=1 Tax=Actinokineospora sp. NBRC 105648 TaxID=3032206 RepID=UPI0024A3673E|nr:zf-HC2 domain-containing protein [Actinokineospora sp. NBRC 105648]GLZ38015.1 membrane protein [Actinokineospora sp. NBRC 105648]
MDCTTCREALSARLDGETEPVPAGDTDAHLARCPACVEWQVRATAATRLIRVRPADPGPDLVEAVLARRPRPVALVPRLALAVVALTQLWIALAQLLSGATGGDHAGHTGGIAGHVFNEGAAWNLALGVGLLFAAVSVTRAAGLLPTLAGFVALLVGLSVHDLAQGTATVSRVASHAPLLVGLVLLVLVSRAARERPAPDSTALRDTDSHTDAPTGSTGEPAPARGRGKGHLRPTGHHEAA